MKRKGRGVACREGQDSPRSEQRCRRGVERILRLERVSWVCIEGKENESMGSVTLKEDTEKECRLRMGT